MAAKKGQSDFDVTAMPFAVTRAADATLSARAHTNPKAAARTIRGSSVSDNLCRILPSLV